MWPSLNSKTLCAETWIRKGAKAWWDLGPHHSLFLVIKQSDFLTHLSFVCKMGWMSFGPQEESWSKKEGSLVPLGRRFPAPALRPRHIPFHCFSHGSLEGWAGAAFGPSAGPRSVGWCGLGQRCEEEDNGQDG